MQSNTYNPMEAGTSSELVGMISRCADVELDLEQAAAAEQVIEALPEGKTVRDFVKAAEQIPSLRRLALAVGRSMLADGEYTRLFEHEYGKRQS